MKQNTKFTITEAVKLIPVSESKLRRDLKAGEISCDVDENGKKRFDLSELRRVYGEMKAPDENGQGNDSTQHLSETRHDTQQIIDLKDNQIADLRSQLAKAEAREDALIEEKTRLLDLTDRL